MSLSLTYPVYRAPGANRKQLGDRGKWAPYASPMQTFLGGAFAIMFLWGIFAYVGPLAFDILRMIFG